ncbi:serine hydrolase domain-containing protein [Algibacter mikhailovii]|uniref:Serine hydrolase n=1 Tax=Algibacter mikhailovii TaxID=425498 RepID=A0A918R1I0_9FLAO|nr:serine hydrolase [Algibacter mikhailovii]GGZ82876.1 serine hydrolase [Algibacter mikhailovii]
MKNIRHFAAILFLVLSAIGCRQTPAKGAITTNVIAKEALTAATLEVIGFNRPIITAIIDSIKTGFYPNRHSLLIYKDDKLVLEEYFSGHDENWGTNLGIIKHHDTVLHDMRSVSKSIVSACIGIAIAQGKIKDVDQPVFDFFEDYQQYNNAGREALTIKHLLTMTSGLKWNEEIPYDNPENSEIQMINSGDGIGFVLSRAIVTKPGTVWKYNGGTTELLAEIIQRVSGKDVHEFAKAFLFKPLGITTSEWTISPATHTPAAASGLRLTSRDMLKFGILFQNEGRWGNAQILPKKWVQESFKSNLELPFGGYGYQFWVFNFDIKGHQLKLPAAVGNGDQRIYFDKKNNLVVVTTAGNYNKWDIKNNASALLQHIYTAFDDAE